MGNKSKSAKIKKDRTIRPQIPVHWLYMCPLELRLNLIKETLESEYSVEYWEEAGVLEVESREDKITLVDFETVDRKRADETTASYIEENFIKTVFLVSVIPEDFAEAKKVMGKVLKSYGGFFCGDTEDFMPVVNSNDFTG